MLFGIQVDAGLLLSGPRAENYPRLHFRVQKERSAKEARRKGYKREDHRTFNSDYQIISYQDDSFLAESMLAKLAKDPDSFAFCGFDEFFYASHPTALEKF